MVTALREFTLLGERYQHGVAIPEARWAQVPLRNQKALEATRFVTHGPVSKRVQAALIADATDPLACWCGYIAKSKQALGGHNRGHVKRGETPQGG